MEFYPVLFYLYLLFSYSNYPLNRYLNLKTIYNQFIFYYLLFYLNIYCHHFLIQFIKFNYHLILE